MIKQRYARLPLPRPTINVSPWLIFRSMWQIFTISEHNEGKMIGGDVPYLNMGQLCTSQCTQDGCQGFGASQGHSATPGSQHPLTPLHSRPSGKPQLSPFQEYLSQDACWIDRGEQEEALLKEQGGQLSNARAPWPFLKGVCAGARPANPEKEASSGLALDTCSQAVMDHGADKAKHGREATSLLFKLIFLHSDIRLGSALLSFSLCDNGMWERVLDIFFSFFLIFLFCFSWNEAFVSYQKLKQSQLVTCLSPTVFKTYRKWPLPMMEQRVVETRTFSQWNLVLHLDTK